MIVLQPMSVEAVIDIDGSGPDQADRMLIDAHIFVLPLGDPLVLLLEEYEVPAEG